MYPLAVFAILIHHAVGCELYFAASRIQNAGRGVFTGISRTKDSILEVAINIPILRSDIETTQLDNYVFDTGFDDYVMVSLSIGSMFNHKDPARNVDYNWSSDHIPHPHETIPLPHSTFADVYFYANDDTGEDEELYISYGADWIADRGLAPESSDPEDNTLQRPQASHAICLSNVEVRESSVAEDAGRGLFARTAFRAGEVITVSPTLVLPRVTIEQTRETSVLWNYCLELEASPEVMLLPLVHIPIVNHGADKRSNAHLQWYFWPSLQIPFVADLTLNTLLEASFAPLDISLVATRDIEEGEEILIDYGMRWEERWHHFRSTANPSEPFRQSIAANLPFPPSYPVERREEL